MSPQLKTPDPTLGRKGIDAGRTPGFAQHPLDGVALDGGTDQALRHADLQIGDGAGRTLGALRGDGTRVGSTPKGARQRKKTAGNPNGRHKGSSRRTAIITRAHASTPRKKRSGSGSPVIASPRRGAATDYRPTEIWNTEGPAAVWDSALRAGTRQTVRKGIRLPGACGLWRDGHAERHDHHGFSGEPGNREFFYDGRRRADRYASCSSVCARRKLGFEEKPSIGMPDSGLCQRFF